MKVAVLDDEEKVCTLICTLIEWEKIGLELTGTASDGISGLELIKSTKPDLLITDIRMPGMTGLELVKAAKELLPDLQVIIISGYSQFDYAQTAINYGVVNYLLKPIKKQELNAVLQKMADKFAAAQKNISKAQRLEKIVAEHEKEKDRAALIAAVGSHSEAENNRISISCPLRISIIKEKIDQLIQEPHLGTFSKGYFFILAVHESVEDHSYLDDLLFWCKSQTQIFRNFTMSIGCGTRIDQDESIQKSALAAFEGLARRLEEGSLQIYENRELLPERQFSVERYVKLFLGVIMQESESAFKSAFDSFKSDIEKQCLEPYYYEIVLQEFSRCFLEESTLHLQLENLSEIQQAAECLLVCASKEQLWKTLYTYLRLVYDLFTAEQHEKYVKPVRLAKSYILQHYNESLICLNTVAGQVGLNCAYFSVLFKKENNGEGFSEYLQNLRIKKAKELLVESTLSVKQIAGSVGYSDPKHFAKVFKSVSGIKPVEYRKLYE